MTHDGRTVEFSLPEVIRDFVFDLHDSCRRSLRLEEVQINYDKNFRDLTESYFSHSAWPDAPMVSSECGNDTNFLYFYREMTLRHLFTKLKPQLADYIGSWNNYVKLFEFLLSKPDPEIVLSVQWSCDIVQEFVYQYQSFCQYRAQTSNRSNDELETLHSSRDIWSLSSVMKILKGMVNISKIVELQASKASDKISNFNTNSFIGYFCLIELARLECLLGDYTASLKVLAPINLWDRTELFVQVITCHVNLFYHTGLCLLMIRRYADAIETFSAIILHISRTLKLMSSSLRNTVMSMLQKMQDRIMALTAIAIALSPGLHIDNQVKELINNKWEERFNRLVEGEFNMFTIMFEFACPKFISPAIPRFEMTKSNVDAYRIQVSTFLNDAQQQIYLLRMRSYLRLYTSIDLEKLSRFNDNSIPEMISQLLAYNHKTLQIQAGHAASTTTTSTSTFTTISQRIRLSDVFYLLKKDILYTDCTSLQIEESRMIDRIFMSGIRKHKELKEDVVRTCAVFGF